MARTTFVTFRGIEDVAIDYTLDDSGPGSGIGIEWTWGDTEMHGTQVTPEEDEAITARILEIFSDPHFYDDPFLD